MRAHAHITYIKQINIVIYREEIQIENGNNTNNTELYNNTI